MHTRVLSPAPPRPSEVEARFLAGVLVPLVERAIDRVAELRAACQAPDWYRPAALADAAALVAEARQAESALAEVARTHGLDEHDTVLLALAVAPYLELLGAEGEARYLELERLVRAQAVWRTEGPLALRVSDDA